MWTKFLQILLVFFLFASCSGVETATPMEENTILFEEEMSEQDSDFEKFTRGEFNAENIYCYRACQRFFTTMNQIDNDEDKQDYAMQFLQEFYPRFIRNGAPDQVNISDPTRRGFETLQNISSDELAKLVGKVQTELYNLVKRDVWPRHVKKLRQQVRGKFSTVFRFFVNPKKFFLVTSRTTSKVYPSLLIKDLKKAWDNEEVQQEFGSMEDFLAAGYDMGLISGKTGTWKKGWAWDKKIKIMNGLLQKSVYEVAPKLKPKQKTLKRAQSAGNLRAQKKKSGRPARTLTLNRGFTGTNLRENRPATLPRGFTMGNLGKSKQKTKGFTRDYLKRPLPRTPSGLPGNLHNQVYMSGGGGMEQAEARPAAQFAAQPAVQPAVEIAADA